MDNIIIDKNSNKPLYMQIRDQLIDLIKNNYLKPGEKLPSVTVFSKQLGVTQATVIRAFEDLTHDNYILSYVGRGTFINDSAKYTKNEVLSGTKESPVISKSPELSIAARNLRMGITRSLESLIMLTNRPGLIKLTSGIPDSQTIEAGILEKMTKLTLKDNPDKYYGYGEPQGLIELRGEIVKRYQKRGIQINIDNIIITNGSQQAVSILAQSALENNQKIICETPGYIGIPRAFGALGHWVETIIRDKDGPDIEKLNRFKGESKYLFYMCPILHHPMGTDVSKERLNNIITWVVNNKNIIIGDEIFYDIHFDKDNAPNLIKETGLDNTVIIGSVSKTFMCGLRIGWLITSTERIKNLIGLKRAMDIGGAQLIQGIAYNLFKSGEYDKHTEKMKAYYKERKDRVIDALNKYMPNEIKWTNPQGGFHMWLELPKGYSSIALFLLAIERGVAITPGPLMDISHRFLNAFRLSYGSYDIEKIVEGVKLVSDSVKCLLKEKPMDPGLSGIGDFM